MPRVPTEYDYAKAGVLGNFNFIKQRYPRDTVLIHKIQHLATYCLQLGALVGSDEDDYQKLLKEIRKDRK